MGAVAPRVSEQDDWITVCALSVLAFILTDVLFEALGHACLGLLTISPMGMLSSSGWSSSYDNAWIDAGGALVTLAASVLLWLLFRVFRRASPATRLFLLLAFAFNLLIGAGYLFFAGLTDFGDWYLIVRGLGGWTAERIALAVGGAAIYAAGLFGIASALASLAERRRMARLTLAAWLSAVIIASFAAGMNSLGIRYVLLSDFPIMMASSAGLLFVPLFAPREALAAGEPIRRSWTWIGVSALLALAFLLLLGKGILLHR